MVKTRILTLTTLAILLLTSLMAASALATTVPSFTLPSQASNLLQYTLPQGTTFSGTISTTGSVRFWVSDPNMAQIVNLGIIDKTASFNFTAQQDGIYTFNFENDLPNSNPVKVSFSYETNPQLPGSNNLLGIPLTYLIAAVIIVLIAVVLIILLVYRKPKNQTIEQEDSTPTEPTQSNQSAQ